MTLGSPTPERIDIFAALNPTEGASMNVYLQDGTRIRCQQWDEVEAAKAANPDWVRVVGWLGETLEENGG